MARLNSVCGCAVVLSGCALPTLPSDLLSSFCPPKGERLSSELNVIGMSGAKYSSRGGSISMGYHPGLGTEATIYYEVREPLHAVDDRTIIFVHGYGGDHTAAYGFVPWESHRTIAFDMPAHGNSSPCPDGVHGPERVADIIEWIVELEGVDRPILAGISAGGMGVLAYVARGHETGPVILITTQATPIEPQVADLHSFRARFSPCLDGFRREALVGHLNAMTEWSVLDRLSDDLPTGPVLCLRGGEDVTTPQLHLVTEAFGARAQERVYPCSHYPGPEVVEVIRGDISAFLMGN